MRLAVFLTDRLPRTTPIIHTTLLLWYLCVRTYIRRYNISSITPNVIILCLIEGICCGNEHLRYDVVSKKIDSLDRRQRLGGF